MAAKHKLQENQFVDFFHVSEEELPPHQLEPHRIAMLNPDALFGGTQVSAIDRMHSAEDDRRWLHHYRVPRHMIRPEIWGDDLHDPTKSYSNERVMRYADHPGPTLWEGEPASAADATPGNVIQYRNHHEDTGSISYIINKKDALPGGPIEYKGVTDLDPNREESDPEDNERKPIRWRSLD